MLSSSLAPLILVVGFWTGFTVPDHLAAPPLCAGGAAISDTTLLVWASFSPDSVPQGDSSGSPAPSSTLYYNLGWRRPGERVEVRLATGAPGWGRASVISARQLAGGSLVYGCWSAPIPVYAQELTCIPGDLNGDGIIDASDLAEFAELQRSGFAVYWPASVGPVTPAAKPAAAPKKALMR